MNLMSPINEIEIKEKITEGLNSEQKEAVVQIGSPLLVLAGAGSGKTRVLTNRIAYFVASGVHPANILAVTFTNKAAKEMKERVVKMVDDDAIGKAWIGTFHSICARILRQDIESLAVISPEGKKRHWTRSFTIFDETDSVNVVKQAIKALDLDPKIYVPKSIKYKISEEKNQKDASIPTSRLTLNLPCRIYYRKVEAQSLLMQQSLQHQTRLIPVQTQSVVPVQR